MIEQSNGSLPKPLPRHQLKIATTRGSHTTSSVQVLDAAIPCKGIHPELCSEDGKISKSKILEKQPSLAQPIAQGIKYFVIKKQLVDACPKLMAMLARTGNVAHTTYREATALQNCIRLHEVLSRDPNDTDDDVIKKASIGLALEFKEPAKFLLPFVRKLSGGRDRNLLVVLEEYEKLLTVKRKIHPADFKAKANIDPLGLERFLAAMVKAELNAPPNFVDALGYSTLFPANGADHTTLASTKKNQGDLRANALEANAWMIHGSNFMDAYCNISSAAVGMKLISEFEVNLVMHVLNKKAETRKSFMSLAEIACVFHDSLVKHDSSTPKWNRIAHVSKSTPAVERAISGGLRELHSSGEIDITELKSRGFWLEEKVEKEGNVWTIKSFNMEEQICELQRKNEDAYETVKITLADLIAKYKLHVEVQIKTFKPWSDFVSPIEVKEHFIPMWSGLVRAGLEEKFKKSSEKDILIHKLPDVKVTADGKSFNTGSLKLVSMSTAISISKESDIAASAMIVAEFPGGYVAVINKRVQYPTDVVRQGTTTKTVVPYLVAYWHCEESFNEDKINAERTKLSYTMKYGSNEFVMLVPTIINTKPIKDGEPITVKKVGHDPTDKRKHDEVDKSSEAGKSKCPKGLKGKGKGRGKNKGK